ncbi:acetyltransferase [Paenibacillus sp. E222]|uniref:acetyltransferase n=1 Tax=Paenibacillus sp. E222 TaxID=2748863 RepID=UPI0015C5F2EB|nr:acetyltransferase [Paenibacillus sp. E222]QLG38209.1 acetyltransferase [Paenibacillus sp. E222]
MGYIIFGTGGHGKVVLDNLRSIGEDVLGVMDDRWSEAEWRGVPFLGGMDHLEQIVRKYSNSLFIVAIGDNATRGRIATYFEQRGVRFGKAVHSSAVISPDACVGEGTVIMANSVVNADVVVGRHVIINTGTTVDHDCNIKDYVHLSPGVHLAGQVEIGAYTHIGIGASLIPEIKVGKETRIGAGACVIRNIPDGATAVGCPAKVIKISN